jgi:Mg2+-importing ATPase
MLRGRDPVEYGPAMDAPTLAEAAALPPGEVVRRLASSDDGLTAEVARARLAEIGPNALASHRATGLRVLANQLRNPLLGVLVLVAVVSGFTGQAADAAIIVVIAVLSILLGFVNEYRSERAIEELRSQIHHLATAVRGGRRARTDVTELVPGDVVELSIGDVVPADVRLLSTDDLGCDESVLTGESMPAMKRAEAIAPPGAGLALEGCAFMGTVVRLGTGRAVVVATGSSTEFGAIATKLSDRPPETAFQRGLRQFGTFLVRVTALLVLGILAINLALGRPFLDAVLFSLAIAVGLTPELLPAIVTISLSAGARRMGRLGVLVRRLVAIEDFGNVEVLFTDKTGTLTEGSITFQRATDARGDPSDRVFELGIVCTDVVLEDGRPTGGSPLDQALWAAPAREGADVGGWRLIDRAAFDYERRRMSVLVDGPDGRVVVTKGAPESVLDVCAETPAGVQDVLDRLYGAGTRVVAVAVRSGAGLDRVSAADETGLTLVGLLTFDDPPKADAAPSLARLAALGVDVRIVTGDNELVARTVCGSLGLEVDRTLTGTQIGSLPDEELAAAVERTTVFARVTPEQKARVIRLAREHGSVVAFMGDGVNDAIALHEADVGISVESATDVAKDAADILLLRKDLGSLTNGVVEGRRIFENTMKYILMATSSNFGNMFSAAAASAFLSFLPMLPTQILLNNLLYDASQTTIPTDRVDEEQLRRPAHWDTAFIRRFMAFFGPISSLFDFATFAVMLWVFHAGPPLFRTGWFIESLATQTLVIFVIRTRRIPFLRSRPSRTQLASTLTCAGLAVAIPYVPPLADVLGFTPPPLSFLAIVTIFVIAYLALAEAGKAWFFRLRPARGRRLSLPPPPAARRVLRRAARWRRTGVAV